MDAILLDLSLAYSTFEYPILTAFMTLVLCLTGAMFASFTGLVVHRIGHLSEDDSILYAISFPPSRCEECGRRLGLIDLIPVIGWVIRRGRCPDCRYSVPKIYPIIEAILGVCTAAIPLIVRDFDWWVLSLVILLWAGFLVAWIDYEHHIIPEELTWFLLFAGLLMTPAVFDVYDRIIGAALCAAAMWFAMFAIGIVTKENTHAGGDVAFAAVAGAWIGVQFVPWYLLILSALYILHAFPLRLRGIKWVPMGPSLVLALLISMLILLCLF